MQNFIPGIAVVLVVLGILFLLSTLRVRAMRILAARWGMQYMGKKLPETFVMDRRRFLYHWIVDPKMVTRVVAGELKGREVVIFDSSAPGRGNMRCTILAVRTMSNPFEADVTPWRVTQSKGWFALWRTGLLQIRWTMSIDEIENSLRRI